MNSVKVGDLSPYIGFSSFHLKKSLISNLFL